MDTTITFHTTREDKEKLKEIASAEKLSVSSYCRFYLLKNLGIGEKNGN